MERGRQKKEIIQIGTRTLSDKCAVAASKCGPSRQPAGTGAHHDQCQKQRDKARRMGRFPREGGNKRHLVALGQAHLSGRYMTAHRLHRLILRHAMMERPGKNGQQQDEQTHAEPAPKSAGRRCRFLGVWQWVRSCLFHRSYKKYLVKAVAAKGARFERVSL